MASHLKRCRIADVPKDYCGEVILLGDCPAGTPPGVPAPAVEAAMALLRTKWRAHITSAAATNLAKIRGSTLAEVVARLLRAHPEPKAVYTYLKRANEELLALPDAAFDHRFTGRNITMEPAKLRAGVCKSKANGFMLGLFKSAPALLAAARTAGAAPAPKPPYPTLTPYFGAAKAAANPTPKRCCFSLPAAPAARPPTPPGAADADKPLTASEQELKCAIAAAFVAVDDPVQGTMKTDMEKWARQHHAHLVPAKQLERRWLLRRVCAAAGFPSVDKAFKTRDVTGTTRKVTSVYMCKPNKM